MPFLCTDQPELKHEIFFNPYLFHDCFVVGNIFARRFCRRQPGFHAGDRQDKRSGGCHPRNLPGNRMVSGPTGAEANQNRAPNKR